VVEEDVADGRRVVLKRQRFAVTRKEQRRVVPSTVLL
jgi:hypothetical protein